MELDHVAIVVADIPSSVTWYQHHLGAQVLYADTSWAFLRLGQGKIALVSAQQHPPHVAVRVSEAQLDLLAAEYHQPIDVHRDGTKGFYFADPDGNIIEIICYPPGETVYEKTS